MHHTHTHTYKLSKLTATLHHHRHRHHPRRVVISGIVKKDPKLPDAVITAPPTQRTTDSVFDQEDKATVSVSCKSR